jgi:ribosomal protein L35AE/L33A
MATSPSAAAIPSKQESAVPAAINAVIANANALVGRELEWAKNSDGLLAKHAEANKNGTIVRTRFPPEPNGERLGIKLRIELYPSSSSLSIPRPR